MHRGLFRAVALYIFLSIGIFASLSANAQTITFHDVDAGQYTPGSTIAVPFKVNFNSGCIAQDNVYELYLSDATGNFATETRIGTFAGAYATFVNGVIPAGTIPGVGYQLRIKTTKPATVSTPTNAITINAGVSVTAGLEGNFINTDPTSPNPRQVFGYCAQGADGRQFYFSGNSNSSLPITDGNKTTTFYNESTNASQNRPMINNTVDITAQATNYTIIEKAFNGVSVGTYAYQLINNTVDNSFSVSGVLDLCLVDGQNKATVSVAAEKLVNNYPGNVYVIDFGDGTVFKLSLCDLKALNYTVSHIYTVSSCGKSSTGGYPVAAYIMTPYCSGVYGQPITTQAKVYINPENKILGPSNGCSNKDITFTNDSYPGQNLTGGGLNCVNDNAKYNWKVDGVIVLRNVSLSTSLTRRLPAGNHTITLELISSSGTCDFAVPKEVTVCIQDPPVPNFEVPARVCLSSATIPVDRSTTTNPCNISPAYTWTVTGPAPSKTYTGTAPQFNFTVPGIYQIVLSIASGECAQIASAPKSIIVDGPPTATLSPNVSVCTKTFTFSNADGVTKTTFSGTAQTEADTYTWTVTGGQAEFLNGSNLHSQYPTINFLENKPYTVTVTHKNTCDSKSATQVITIQDAPKVDAGTYAPICSTEGKITLSNAEVGAVSSYRWISSGTGTFDNPNALKPTYTFSSEDIAAGKVTLTLIATTSLAAPCNEIPSAREIIILPQPVVLGNNPTPICSGQALNYTLTSNATNPTFTWTASSSNVTGFTANGSGNTINDVLTTTGNAAGTVTYVVTPAANGCPGISRTFTVTVNPLPAIRLTTANTEICSNSNAIINLASNITGTSYTWESTTTGSVTGNTRQSTPVATTTINDVLVNGSNTSNATVTYIITPYNGSCAGDPQRITITVKPAPVTATVAKPSDEICGTVTSYQLQGNNPAPGTGEWTTVSPAGANPPFSNKNDPQAIVSGLIPGTTYQFRWTIAGAAGCPPSVITFTLVVDRITIGGTTRSNLTDNTVCSGTNSGTITVSGYTGNIVGWQSSTDNFTNNIQTQNINNTSISFTNLTQTTQYRAIIKSGVCDVAYSAATTITVNPAIGPVNAGPDQSPCNQTIIQLLATDNINGGFWTQVSGPRAGIVSPNQASTAVTDLIPGNTYVFRWTVTSTACGAPQSDEVTIVDQLDTPPSFVPSVTRGCGNTLVTFRNTSYGNNVTTPPAGATFLWTYTDGVTPRTATTFSPQITLPASTSKDIRYRVTLKITSNCNINTEAFTDILISPAIPVASLTTGPISGCSPFQPSAEAFLFETGDNNSRYTYNIIDKATNRVIPSQTRVKLDKSAPVFNPITQSGSYAYRLTVLDNCNTEGISIDYPFTVLPPDVNPVFAIKNNKMRYCIGEGLTLQNGSAGGTEYNYIITNTTTNQTLDPLGAGGSGTETPWIPPAVGTYTIKINGKSNCKPQGQNSPTQTIVVNSLPEPSFTADTRTACSSLTVQFTNTTPANAGTAASSLTYRWDFGDASAPVNAYRPATHLYRQPGRYRVTLTATNTATGCSAITSVDEYIIVTAPPNTDFSVSPGLTITVPNYKFTFTDQTTGTTPVSWTWTFGDGSSAEYTRNPTHTYADPGKYTVTLATKDASGCPSFKTREVEITGVRGELYLPNAFIPTSETGELRTFKAKGVGLKAYRMQIFNNYGQLIWETTRLNSDGTPAEGWDGTYRGAPAPQGVYVWQMSASFINGSDWKGMSFNNEPPKRTGVIHLIR